MDQVQKALNKFDEYISWIDDMPKDTPKDHYKKILKEIKADLESTLST